MREVKTETKRYIVRLVPLVVGVLVLLFYWNGRGEAKLDPSEMPASPESREVFQEVMSRVRYGKEARSPDYRFKAPPGRVIEYDFNIRHEVVMHLPKNPMDGSHGDLEPQQMNLRVKGTLVCAAYASDLPDRLLLGFEVTGIEMNAEQEVSRHEKEHLSRAMRHEVFAYITPMGRFERLYFAAEMPPQTRNLAREIILRSQIILPESPAPGWDSMEEDATGLFEAKYQGRVGQLDGKNILEVIRKKVSYVTINSLGAGSAKEIPTNPSGSTTAIVMLEEGWLRDLHSSEGLKAGGGSFMVRVREKTEAGLLFQKIWQDTDREKLGAQEMAERLSGMESASPIGLENAEADAEARRLDRLESLAGGRSFRQALNEILLPLFELEGLQGREASRARKILAAIFELDPAQVAEALSRMKSGVIPVELMALIATAFGQAGTPSAQSALVELITDEQMDPKVRMPSLLAMVSPKTPTLEAQRALQALVDPNDPRGLGVNTLLILGAMARNLNRFGGEGRDDTMAFLLDQEGAFQESGKTEVFLSAIGNARDDRGFQAVSRYLGDSSENIRVCAVDALAGMGHKEVPGRLIEALEDTDDVIKVRAIHGLQQQAYTAAAEASVRKVLATSGSVYVRKASLRYFQKHMIQNPGAMEVLRKAASDDPDEDVRKMARQIVQ